MNKHGGPSLSLALFAAFAVTVVALPLWATPDEDRTEECELHCSAWSPYAGTVNEPVCFEATAYTYDCTVSVTYFWVFGDGATSTEQNPCHTYTDARDFWWALTCTSDVGNCFRDGWIYVSAHCPQSCTVDVPSTSTLGMPTPFLAAVTGSDCTVGHWGTWDFGDGQTSSGSTSPYDPYIYHTYASSGIYNWTFSAGDYGWWRCMRSGTLAVLPLCCDCRLDVKRDGSIDIRDLVKIQRVILGIVKPHRCRRCDVDRSGTVDIVDMILVQMRILGMSPCG
jgi:hypothetical protein